MAAESRVSRLEECDCKKKCIYDGIVRQSGEMWSVDCIDCICESGVVSCGPKKCGPLACKHPKLYEGECCPKCLSKLIFYALYDILNKIVVFGFKCLFGVSSSEFNN